MPFVPGHQYDVFLSYRQADNQHGWVTRLEETLRSLLAEHRRPGKAEPSWRFEVFRDDHEIGGNAPLGDRVEAAVSSAATLIVVLSDNYVATDSDWCERELASFRRAVAGRPQEAERVFVVHRTPVEVARRPPALRDLIGYRLWEADPKTGVRQPISFDFSATGRVPAECQRLGNELFQTLQKLTAGPPARLADPSGPTVFLAEVTDELYRERAGWYTFLEQEGIRVVPAKGQQYRFNPDAADAELVPLIAEPTLVVLLHGRTPIPSDDRFGPGIEAWLVDRAKAAGKRPGHDLLQWRRQGTQEGDIADAAHRALVFAPDVVADDLEPFKQAVVKKVRELAQRGSMVVGRRGVKVLVTAKREHRRQADDVADSIDQTGMAMLPDPVEAAIVDQTIPLEVVTREFEAQQSAPRGLVVFHADADEPWVQARMQECRRYQLSRRANPPPCAVVVDPPDDQPHPKATPARFEVIRQDDPAALAAFLTRVGKGAN